MFGLNTITLHYATVTTGMYVNKYGFNIDKFSKKWICFDFVYTPWGIKNVAVNFLQQRLQILTDCDKFCIKLTR